MRKFSFLLLFLLVKTAGAQMAWPAVFEIKKDTPVASIDEAYRQMLEDSTGYLTLDNVMASTVASRFHANSTARSRGIGYAPVHHYWQRARLTNRIANYPNISI